MMIPPFERSFLPLYLMCGRTIPLALAYFADEQK